MTHRPDGPPSTRLRRRPWLVGVVVLSLVVGLLVVGRERGPTRGAGPLPAVAGPEPAATMIVGDSVTALSKGDLELEFDRPQILAHWGFRTGELLPGVPEGGG